MDRELIEYFDRRFDENREEINRRFDESDRRNEERFDALGARIDETNRRFDESDHRNEERFDALGARIDDNSRRLDGLRRDMNDGLRHNRVLIEDLTGKMELVIEGVVGFRQELKQDVRDVRGEVREVQTRPDVAYRLLDRRIQAGEAADF